MINTPKCIVVTGAGGFVGRRLVAALGQQFPTARLIGVDRTGRTEGQSETRSVDILDVCAVDGLISDVQPDALVHLAALASVPASVADPRSTWRTNVMGTLEVVTALQRHAPRCHLLYVSSAEVYGRSAFSGEPVNEDTLLQPANPYAASKAAADILVREAAQRGLHAVLVRPFNHTGPGQDTRFVIPAFCEQVARIEKGLQQPEMFVGELDDERDFLSVDDVVDLYVRVVQNSQRLPNGFVLNAASGRSRRVGDILKTILAASDAKIAVKVDPSRLRPNRIPRIVGDASRAQEALNWKPEKPFEQMLLETLDYWRSQV